jgi:hypothetical protein
VGATDLVAESIRLERALSRPPLIRCAGKRALDQDWPSGPVDDPDAWRARLAGHVGNVGLVMGGGVLAVDCDTYKPGGEDSFKALIADTGLDPGTVTQLTGRGGTHLLYAYDADRMVRSVPLTPRGYPHIEIKATGGYIIVEPSIHPDTGRPYAWEHLYAPGVVAVDPATETLLGMLDPASAWRRPGGGDARALDPANVEAADLLEEHFGGHDVVIEFGGYLSMRRPGKADGSHSATIGYIGPGVVKMWSDSWPPFEQHKVYDLAQLRTLAGVGPRLDDDVRPLYVLPPGYRVWTPGTVTGWPTLADAGRHGPVGRYLDLIEGHTEAGAAAVGGMLLAELGTLIGRRAGVRIGEIEHHANVFELVVGETSTGAKGTADLMARRFVNHVDRNFFLRHAIGGFGSGEALIAAIADPKDGEDRVVEKRRCIIENEFSALLRVARRETTILSDVIRQGFDYQPIRHSTKTGGDLIATGHHLAVIGSITPAEFRNLTGEVDFENGWLNRYLFVPAVMNELLPFGGRVDAERVSAIAADVVAALDALEDELAVNGVHRWYVIAEGTAVGDLWGPWYRSVRHGSGRGVVKALTRRQVVHAARLMVILAVLDQAGELRPEHFHAATAWTDLSVETARRLFQSVVTGQAGRLLDAIRAVGEEGLSHADQSAVFHRNLKSDDLEQLRRSLIDDDHIMDFAVSTGGRPKTISVAVTKKEVIRTKGQAG